MDTIGYFGFGSLVNRQTLRTDYLHQVPARLKGWRRHWQGRTENLDPDVALLSIHRDEACSLDGVLVIDHAQNLAALDERERGYRRHRVAAGDLELLALDPAVNPPEDIYVYVAENPHEIAGEGALLQSYCDAVLQGYFHHFGEAGVEHFVATTRGFERMLIRDRDEPLYPRGVQLTADEQVLFDRALARAGIRFA